MKAICSTVKDSVKMFLWTSLNCIIFLWVNWLHCIWRIWLAVKWISYILLKQILILWTSSFMLSVLKIMYFFVTLWILITSLEIFSFAWKIIFVCYVVYLWLQGSPHVCISRFTMMCGKSQYYKYKRLLNYFNPFKMCNYLTVHSKVWKIK